MNQTLIFERYPDLFLLFAAENTTPPKKPEKDLTAWADSLETGDADNVYLFGIGTGEFYIHFKTWLKTDPRKQLIVLEDHLSTLKNALFLEKNKDLLTDPQVHLVFLNRQQKEGIFKQLISQFPAAKIAVFALPEYLEKKGAFFKKSKVELLRKAAVHEAFLMEALYADEMIVNVLANLKQWQKSFFANALKDQFRGVPAVICGAGPSLTENMSHLKSLEDKALIIAGGSAIAALSNQGVIPHIGVAFDPNPEEYDRLKIASAYEMPLLYGTRVNPLIFQTTNAPLGYLQTFTGGPCEIYFEEVFSLQNNPIGLDLGKEAFSVTTLCLALAVALGCHPILLNGIDLSYTGMKRYAEGIMPSSHIQLEEMRKQKRAPDQLLQKKGFSGKMLYTLVRWVMESECIGAYAQKQEQTTFINVGRQGLGFPGIENRFFAEVASSFKQSYDLRGLLHAKMQTLSIEVSQATFEETLQSLKESLNRLLASADALILECKKQEEGDPSFSSGKIALLTSDFEEETAFYCFLRHIEPVLESLLERTHLPQEQARKERRKWEHFKEVILKHKKHLGEAFCD